MLKYLIALICFSSFANSLPPLDLSGPRQTFNYYLKSMKAYKQGDSKGLENATKALSVGHIDENIREFKAQEYAKGLIDVLDKIERVDVNTIPKSLNQNIWYFKEDTFQNQGKRVEAQISLRQGDDKKWLFTKRTLDSISIYQLQLKDRDYVKDIIQVNTLKSKLYKYSPKWFFNTNFLLQNIQWIGLAFIIMVSFIIERLIKLYLARQVVKFLNRRNIEIKSKTKNKFSTPVGLLAFAYSFKFLIRFLDLPDNFLLFFLKGSEILIVVSTIVALVQLIDIVCLYLEDKAAETENKFDDILIPLVRKTLRFFVCAIGLVLIGDTLSLNMKNILAGMGIGGIAFALAAKDTIGNVFGSFTVLVDRPFSIGDIVKINNDIEGTVVEVGLRSTRIKTFYDSIITVPNGNLTNAYIDNLGKREFRRFSTTLGVDYSTPVEKIENFCEGIRQIILSHPLTRKDNFHVYFTGLGDSSLNILLYVFWKVPDWSCELNEKHNLLLDIMRLAKKMNISFAFPTRTLNLINEEKLSYTHEEIDFSATKKLVEGFNEQRTLREGNRSSHQMCD